MEIINHGKFKKEDEKYVTFECSRCGCEFKAKRDEYHEDSIGFSSVSYPMTHYLYANCPECHKMCSITTKEEVKNCTVTLSESNTKDYYVENPTGSDSNHGTSTTTHKTEASYCGCVVEVDENGLPRVKTSCK